jgi:DNA-binding transcriptional ArsR family regulator
VRDDDDLLWKALSDPNRRGILDLLRSGPQRTGEICARFSQSRFGVMKHLAILEQSHLITVERQGRERWNYLNGATLGQAMDRWLDRFQLVWAGRLAALNRFVDGETPVNWPHLGIDLQQTTRLRASQLQVFTALTEHIDAWWGQTYRQTGAGSTLSLEPYIGAALVETASDGHAVIWGRIEELHAPSRLSLSGRFAVGGAVAGRVDFALEPCAEGCNLSVTHRAVGAIPDVMRERFVAGWKDLLDVRLRGFLGE